MALLQNVALLKGQSLTYKCNMSINAQFHNWHFIPLGAKTDETIYDAYGLDGEYLTRAQVNNSSLTLTIQSIRLDDAGIYGCKTSRNSKVIHERAQVIVIGVLHYRKSLFFS